MKKNESYVCPICGESDKVTTEDYEIDCDCLVEWLYCKRCDESWKEYHILTYDGYSYNGNYYYANGDEEN